MKAALVGCLTQWSSSQAYRCLNRHPKTSCNQPYVLPLYLEVSEENRKENKEGEKRREENKYRGKRRGKR